MRLKMKKLLLLLLVCCSFTLHAEWYEVEGEAIIIDNDVDIARELAVRNALKQALLYAGASVSSLQSFNGGKILSDSFQVRMDGEVRDIRLKSESIKRDKITVQIVTDIVADRNKCLSAGYQKSVSLLRFDIRHREQASYGGIYNINESFSRLLYQSLRKNSQTFDAREFINQNIGFSGSSLPLRGNLTSQEVKQISKSADSQYIILGSITDLSTFKPAVNGIAKIFAGDLPDRNFRLNIQVFDGFNGNLLFDRNYSKVTKWEFAKHRVVDTDTLKFWRSEFGISLQLIIDDVLFDLDASLQCKLVEARVIAVDGNEVNINIGRNNGLKLGDKFMIKHTGSYVDQFGISRKKETNSSSQVEVTKLYEQQASLITVDRQPTANVQIDDLVILN